MAVTKQVYTATPTITNATAANIFRSAFIDAGLMTEWYDSFLSGSVENRILEVVYDGAKTYGKTYYWFMFSNSNTVSFHVTTGWDAVNHIPTGTQYLDYYNTTTNSTGSLRTIFTYVSNTNLSITRYTSGVNTNHSWFVISQGSTYFTFHITKPGVTFHSWVDLNKGFLNLMYDCSTSVFNRRGIVEFLRYCSLRRELGRGITLNGSTTAGDFIGTNTSRTFGVEYSYNGLGLTSNDFANNTGTSVRPGIILPTGFNAVNSAYTTNSSPVFHSLPYCQWITNTLPSDFGVNMLYTANTVALFDKLIVSTGTEEWEVVNFTNNAVINTGATPLFLARVV